MISRFLELPLPYKDLNELVPDGNQDNQKNHNLKYFEIK
jgi:hypothetical protein